MISWDEARELPVVAQNLKRAGRGCFVIVVKAINLSKAQQNLREGAEIAGQRSPARIAKVGNRAKSNVGAAEMSS
jgi:hypothetical protein